LHGNFDSGNFGCRRYFDGFSVVWKHGFLAQMAFMEIKGQVNTRVFKMKGFRHFPLSGQGMIVLEKQQGQQH